MNIWRPYLDLIEEGVKTVEVRVGCSNMRKIHAGQDLAFVSGDRRLMTKVTRVTEYPSFEEMLENEDPRSIGSELGESRQELRRAIKQPGDRK
ncbi:ASCH domain-containing protein [Actinomadura sp. 6N118]|uniref:ASCH domain-containing protein n=1 Tax=Actinomadura sp. 6N118 TaxID=3375151 RepID=UPI00379442FC